MANERLLRALDQLAGVAGEEISNAREFQFQQNQRLEALARLKEQQDREFQLEQSKLDVMRGQLQLSQEKQKFEQGAELAAKEGQISDLEAQNKFLDRKMQLLKAEQSFSGAAYQAVLDQEKALQDAFQAGAPEEYLDEQQRYLNMIMRRATGQEFFGEDVDFEAAQQRQEAQPISPLSKEGTDLTLKFQDRAQKYSEDFETVRNNVSNIEVATERMLNADKGARNRIATDQAVITSFNKILDPTSVVRESEYERTPANTSLVNRAKGALDKIKQGGAGLTPQDIVEIRDTARQMAELRREILNKKLDKLIRQPAAKRGLDPEEIAPLFDPLELPPPGESQVQGFRDINQDTTGTTEGSTGVNWINEYNKSRR